MLDSLYNTAWRLGLHARRLARRAGILGNLDRFLLRLSAMLIPAPKCEVIVTLPGQISMAVPSGLPSARSYRMGLYETLVTSLFLRILKPGMSFLDLGSNVGYYSLLGSHVVGTKGSIWSFEPDSQAYAYLQRNLSINHCTNVLPVQKAIWSFSGEEYFMPGSDIAQGSVGTTSGQGSMTKVSVVTLDAFFASLGWPRVDLVKMDIEGAESFALEGMSQLSSRNPQMELILEWNIPAMRKQGAEPQDVQATLMNLGFTTAVIIERPGKPCQVGKDFPKLDGTYNLYLTKE